MLETIVKFAAIITGAGFLGLLGWLSSTWFTKRREDREDRKLVLDGSAQITDHHIKIGAFTQEQYQKMLNDLAKVCDDRVNNLEADKNNIKERLLLLEEEHELAIARAKKVKEELQIEIDKLQAETNALRDRIQLLEDTLQDNQIDIPE